MPLATPGEDESTATGADVAVGGGDVAVGGTGVGVGSGVDGATQASTSDRTKAMPIIWISRLDEPLGKINVSSFTCRQLWILPADLAPLREVIKEQGTRDSYSR